MQLPGSVAAVVDAALNTGNNVILLAVAMQQEVVQAAEPSAIAAHLGVADCGLVE